MPEGAEVETVSMEQYKKLQRELAKRDKAAKKAEEHVESLVSGIERLETLLEGMAQLMGDDDERKTVVDGMLGKNKERRDKDTTSAQLTARLSQLIDSSDYDWEDEQFDSARRLLDSINETGDLSRAHELESMIREVIKPSDDDFEARVAAEVANRTREGARVDNNEGANVNRERVRRADLAYNPREGIEGLRKRLEQAQDQMAN